MEGENIVNFTLERQADLTCIKKSHPKVTFSYLFFIYYGIKEIPENTCLRGACIFFDTHYCAQMYFGNDGPYFHDKTQYPPIECMITTRNKCNGNCIENIVYGKCPDTFVRDTIGKKLLSHAYTNDHQR